MSACEPERRHVSELNPLYDVWITVISSYLTDGYFSKNKNTALCLCWNRLTGPVPPLLWRGSDYPDRSELDRRLLSSTSSIRHQVIKLRSLKMPFGKEDAYFVASLIAGQITLEKEPLGLFDGPGWLSYKLNTKKKKKKTFSHQQQLHNRHFTHNAFSKGKRVLHCERVDRPYAYWTRHALGI